MPVPPIFAYSMGFARYPIIIEPRLSIGWDRGARWSRCQNRTEPSIKPGGSWCEPCVDGYFRVDAGQHKDNPDTEMIQNKSSIFRGASRAKFLFS
jgi:hypothetical protein